MGKLIFLDDVRKQKYDPAKRGEANYQNFIKEYGMTPEEYLKLKR